MSESILLTEEERQERGHSLTQLIEQDVRDRLEQVERIRFVRRAYFGPSDAPKYGRVPKSKSDIELRVVTEKIEGMVPKVSNAFWNADPVVNVHMVSQTIDEDLTDLNQNYVNYLFDQGVEDIYATTQMWFRNTHVDGVSTLKVYYDYSTRPTVLCEPMKIWWMAGDIDHAGVQVPADRVKTPLDLLVEYFGKPATPGSAPPPRALVDVQGDVDPAEVPASWDDLAFFVSFIDDSVYYEDVLVQFDESKRIDEIMLYVHRDIVEYDGVRVEVVEFEDLIVPFRTTNLQTAPRVTHQAWYTLDEIREKVESEEWDLSDEDMERLEASISGERQEEIQENTELKRQKDAVTGTSGQYTSSGVKGHLAPFTDNRLLVFEVFCRDKVTDRGTSEVVYQIPYALRKIVSAEYLEERWPHGRRPFPSLHYLRISDRWYSIGMGEILAPIQVEVNAIVNMVNDAQELLNNPFFFYVPVAFTEDPESLENIRQGQGIPVADINSVLFPTFPQQPLANLSAVDSMLLFADRLTISPQASAGSNQTRNAPRTARGTLALLSESGIKTDMFVDDAARGGWPELAHQIHALESWFGSEEKHFYVTGQRKPSRVSQKQLRGRFMYRFHGNSVNTNREVMRGIAQMRYATLSPDPLYLQDLQARQHLVDDFLRHFGEGADIEKLRPKLPGQTGDRLPLPPETGLRMMINGMPLSAHPMEDHAAWISHIGRFTQSKEYNLLPEAIAALIAANYVQHVQMQQAAMVAQGGQAQQPGQSNNVPSELGNLEGGVQ